MNPADAPSPREQALEEAPDTDPSDLLELLFPLDDVYHAEWLGIATEPTVTVNLRGFYDSDLHGFIDELAERAGWVAEEATPQRDRVTLTRVDDPGDGVCPWCDTEMQQTTSEFDDDYVFLSCNNSRCPNEW